MMTGRIGRRAVLAAPCVLATRIAVGNTPFADALAAFAAEDAVRRTPRGALLFVGSSTIRLWPDLAADMAPWPVIQRGFGGATLLDVVMHADLLFAPHRPAAVVLYAGENDVAEGADADTVVSRLRWLQARRRALAETSPPLVFLGHKPSPARFDLWPAMQATNRAVAELPAPDGPAAIVDLAAWLLGVDGRPVGRLYAADGLHLAPAGYARLRAAVRDAVRMLAAAGGGATPAAANGAVAHRTVPVPK